ncbi:Metallo-dependent phosphatase-like protein [Aspergillus ambiguus]|uniref:Metallo-dependent phosphatase-like protein n=1 Tax=Aspergillus ambiguus TaxID=176160 RepID=UPI003CCDB196
MFYPLQLRQSIMSMFNRRRSGLGELLHRPRPSIWQQFFARPCVFLAQKLYSWHQAIPPEPVTSPISIVCISDTHNSQPPLPDGDILIHAGDLTQSGSLKELDAALTWLRAQPHRTKIVVAGNHDLLLDPSRDGAAKQTASERTNLHWGDITYLENEETTVVCENGRQLRVYGSPYSAQHGNWAFQYPRSQDVWTGSIPDGVDILITHGPPRAHLDLLNLGCVHLLRALWRVRPRLHVFGHVHEGAGTEQLLFNGLQDTYERTIIAGGGLCNLASTMKRFISAVFSPAVEAKCLLVNASIVGGLRDDERRQPIRVVI